MLAAHVGLLQLLPTLPPLDKLESPLQIKSSRSVPHKSIHQTPSLISTVSILLPPTLVAVGQQQLEPVVEMFSYLVSVPGSPFLPLKLSHGVVYSNHKHQSVPCNGVLERLVILPLRLSRISTPFKLKHRLVVLALVVVLLELLACT